jgi:hypothetical protein
MSEQRLLMITDEAEYKSAGLPFKKQNQLRWLHRHRHTNGFAAAFVQLGSRWALDVNRFHEIARAQANSSAA